MSPVQAITESPEYKDSIPRAKRKTEAGRWAGPDLAALMESASQVLPEYSQKLDRIIQSILDIWNMRERQANKYTKDVAVAAGRDLDPLLQIALSCAIRELDNLSKPLKDWIDSLSAILEEGQIGKAQRLELRLRLTEIESKYETALSVAGQFSHKE